MCVDQRALLQPTCSPCRSCARAFGTFVRCRWHVSLCVSIGECATALRGCLEAGRNASCSVDRLQAKPSATCGSGRLFDRADHNYVACAHRAKGELFGSQTRHASLQACRQPEESLRALNSSLYRTYHLIRAAVVTRLCEGSGGSVKSSHDCAPRRRSGCQLVRGVVALAGAPGKPLHRNVI